MKAGAGSRELDRDVRLLLGGRFFKPGCDPSPPARETSPMPGVCGEQCQGVCSSALLALCLKVGVGRNGTREFRRHSGWLRSWIPEIARRLSIAGDAPLAVAGLAFVPNCALALFVFDATRQPLPRTIRARRCRWDFRSDGHRSRDLALSDGRKSIRRNPYGDSTRGNLVACAAKFVRGQDSEGHRGAPEVFGE